VIIKSGVQSPHANCLPVCTYARSLSPPGDRTARLRVALTLLGLVSYIVTKLVERVCYTHVGTFKGVVAPS
jgi:hypothetical protein